MPAENTSTNEKIYSQAITGPNLIFSQSKRSQYFRPKLSLKDNRKINLNLSFQELFQKNRNARRYDNGLEC